MEEMQTYNAGDGRVVTVIWLTDDYEPVSPDKATLCKMDFSDGESAFFHVTRDESRAAAATRYPMLDAADAAEKSIRVAVDYAFARGRASVDRKALRRAKTVAEASHAVANVSLAVKSALVKTLPASLMKAFIAGGEATVGSLRVAAEWDESQHPRDKSGKFGEGGADASTHESFKEWFGKSKVVDEDGQPLVVYKAMYAYDYTKETKTDKGPVITSIDRQTLFPAYHGEEPGVKIAGFFGSKDVANKFANVGGKQAVYPVVLSIQKPFVMDGGGKPAKFSQFGEEGKPFRDAIRSGKYDGVIIKNTSDEGTLYVALKPEQIKSAIGSFKDRVYERGSKYLSEFRSAKRDITKKIAGSPLEMSFDTRNDRSIEWAKKHAAELIDDLSDTTRQAIADAIVRGFESGTPEDVSSDVRDALFEDEVLGAIGDDARAEMIAKTESMRAVNGGQREAWNQAVDNGLLSDTAQRVWIATEVGACDECDALDGQMAPLDGEYADGSEGPPLHPNCRCTEGLQP